MIWENIINHKELGFIYKTLYKMGDKVTPPLDKVFTPFKLCSYNNLKVVMIGQDPYYQKGIATGILFGNKKDTEKLSKSLELIKESVINYEIPHNKYDFDITLESWCKQGVLMINAALTTEINKTNAHSLLWRPFIIDLLQKLSIYNTGIIYVLFGEKAQSFIPYINKDTNYILTYHHPAYAIRNKVKFNCDAFKIINNILKSNNNIKINWYNEY